MCQMSTNNQHMGAQESSRSIVGGVARGGLRLSSPFRGCVNSEGLYQFTQVR